jgi:hypothetical protein
MKVKPPPWYWFVGDSWTLLLIVIVIDTLEKFDSKKKILYS